MCRPRGTSVVRSGAPGTGTSTVPPGSVRSGTSDGSGDGSGVESSGGGVSLSGGVGAGLGDGVGASAAGVGDAGGETGGICAGIPGGGVFAAGGAAVSPTVTGPRTEPVTGANPLRSGSRAARLQLTRRVPAFHESSVRLSQ